MQSYDVVSSTEMKWYEIWWFVWTHPSPETFRSILKDPNAGANRGFLWVGAAALILSLVSIISMYDLAFMACIIILTPIFAVIGLAFYAGIYHLVARLFGGSGTWNELVYCLAAISAPASLLSVPGAMLYAFSLRMNAADFVLLPMCLLQLVALGLGLYAIVLNISAIDGVERIGTGKAVATYFIPILVIFFLAMCAVTFGLVPFLQSLQ